MESMSPQNITNDSPANMDSKGSIIVLNGSEAKEHDPTSQHEHSLPNSSAHINSFSALVTT